MVSEINQLVQKRPKCPSAKLRDHTSQEKKTRRKTITGNAQTLRQKYLEKCVVFEDSIVAERGSHLRELPHVCLPVAAELEFEDELEDRFRLRERDLERLRFCGFEFNSPFDA